MSQREGTIVSHWQDDSIWTTQVVRPEKQFEYWCDFVNHAYLRWSIKRERVDSFPAFTRHGRFDEFRVTNMTCARPMITGTRGESEIACESEPLYMLLYIAEGSEHVVLDRKEMNLRKGHFLLWDLTRPMTFVLGEGFRILSLALPHERLHALIPEAEHCLGRVNSADRGLNRILADHLVTLEANFGDMLAGEALQTLDSTTALLAVALESGFTGRDATSSSGLLRRIRSYALQNLEDPALSPRSLATHHGITPRHLHRLFASVGETPARWIQAQRLERCRRELASSRFGDATITEIALRWGFTESSGFSRAFKRRYGRTPRQYRLGVDRTPGVLN